MTFYPLLLNYIETNDLLVEAYQEELRGFYLNVDYLNNMDSFLDRNILSLLKDENALNHFAGRVESNWWELDRHLANLKYLKQLFTERGNLDSTPDMPYNKDIFRDYSNSKIISKDWIELRDYNIKLKASINNSRPYNYRRIR